MKIYKTQADVDADTVDGTLKIDGDVRFDFNVVLEKFLSVSGFIRAGGSIRAGVDFGIYCGLSMRISMESKCFVTAKERPKNLLIGDFRKKE